MKMLEISVQNNIFAKLDARVKLLFGLELIILFYLVNTLTDVLVILVFPLVIYIWMNSLKSFFTLLWSFKWYFLIFVLFGYFLTKALTLLQIIVLMLKFTGLFLAFSSISRTTTPDEITEILIKLKLPPSLSWNIGVTLRQVYFIYGEIAHIRSIQQINNSSEQGRLKSISELLVSLYANAILRANMFTRTLRARGFQGAHREIITYEQIFDRHDIVALLFAVLPSVIYLIMSSQLFI